MNKFTPQNIFRQLSVILLLAVLMSSCSKKVVSPEVQRLQSEKEILSLNTKLNKLNLALEKELENVKGLVKDVNKANDKASRAAEEAKKKSAEISKNPGDSRLATKAEKAARDAARQAKRATKLNKKLGDANDAVKSYQKDIKTTESKLNDLKTKIDFVPNQPE